MNRTPLPPATSRTPRTSRTPSAPPPAPFVPAPACEVPAFPPLRVHGARLRLRRALRRAGRTPATLLALTAATLAVAGPGATPGPAPATAAPEARAPSPAPPARLVSAPVRIADAETVRLLRPGDRVDVIAAPYPNSPPYDRGSTARVIARGARVAEVPPPGETRPDGGALIVLSVPRATATTLAGAGVTSQLAVILC